MSADKRTVATDALDTLGTLIDDKQKRDAIHLAVEPVIAGEYLRAGQEIYVDNGYAYNATKQRPATGIVDPFLRGDDQFIKGGQRFWFIMLPRTVRSLRHVWSHPDFPDEGPAVQKPEVTSKEASEKWLREFCAKADCPPFDIVMACVRDGNVREVEEFEWDGETSTDTRTGYLDSEYMHFNGWDAHSAIPPEFWDHAENYLGVKIETRPSYFSCSC